ncbi:hypothetical protein WME98_26440 [Sorangium sp. So ce296]|uniref:hypothetical protein n=1 Tax=Sorangium sp. So ce296 TaxID=3133296 RepID=UPI003F62EF02
MKKRRMRWGTRCAALLLTAAGCEGCWSHIADDCEQMLTCPHFLPDGEGGDTPPDCVPSAGGDAVDDACGVFVATGGDNASDGAKDAPVKTLAAALALAEQNGTRRVYVCAETFKEVVEVKSGVTIYGGLDCTAGWSFSPEARSAIEGPADEIGLTLAEGASGAKVRSFAVRAASATVAGGSSIGVAVADVEAKLSQVDVIAGDGMDGAKGETPAEAPQAGAPAGAVSNACDLVFGGEAGVTTCEDGETRGGPGGRGGSPGIDEGNGQRGEDGAPLPEENPNNRGLGGIGQTDAAGECEAGENGKSGDPGVAGDAGTATVLTLDGITGGDGDDGTNGKKGQGGGGGGGAKAGLFCPAGASTVEGPGASGGGGGAGGCGGKGGGGGKAGGSSIGILSLGTKLVLIDVTVAVGKAGKGGDGADGQNGANGGAGASGGTASEKPPSIPGCDGGRGGRGGAGGPGAGGRGGHAVGIAYAATPSEAPAVQFTPGTAGNGGSIAPGGPPKSAGAPGSAGSCWDFATGKSCGQ